MIGWIAVLIDGWLDAWMVELMDGWVVLKRSMDGWLNG